jgi:small subunit ribosomal protein S2
MPRIGIRDLLEAGAHFGHQTQRWNPKMRRYIFEGPRRGIYIIDLSQTVKLFDDAYDFVADIVAGGKPILFVGTKKQAQEIIREEAARAGQFYVTNRWLGGTLTNWRTIKKSIARLRQIEKMQADGTAESMTKKERIKLERARVKLERNLGGIKDMDKMPGAIFMIDPKKEHIAVHEARVMDIPVVAVVDTNCDPEPITKVIPGNDDAIRAIRLFAAGIADACNEGKRRMGERRTESAGAAHHAGMDDEDDEMMAASSAGDAGGPEVQRVVKRPKIEGATTGTN